jgi:parallel beta-helix repeat protein
MSDNGRFNVLVVLALLIGVSGVGLGAYSTFFQTPVTGPPGEDGEDGLDGVDGVDGKDAPGGIVVGILDPDSHDIVSGVIEIRALIAGSNNFSVSVFSNSSEIGTQIPFSWDTTSVADGWWNITVEVIDIPSGNQTQDEVIIYVMNIEEDVPIYYCASEEEINDALTDIGTGAGTIYITENIHLTNTINVNGGGSYIIQGVSPSIFINCSGDRTAINIDITSSCIVRDLTIHAQDVVTTTLPIIMVSDSLTQIENIKIFGDSDRTGRGIYVNAQYVEISNCFITNVRTGIYAWSLSDDLKVSDNSIFYCDTGSAGHGIYLYGDRSICTNNLVQYCRSGIYVYGYYSIVSNNMVYYSFLYGIQVYSDYCTISNNIVRGYSVDAGVENIYGILCATGSDYNVFSGNNIYFIVNSGAGDGIGLGIEDSSCDQNTVVGNSMFNCNSNYLNYGTNTLASGNNYS